MGEPELILAIDPGDVHVGVALFDRNEDGWFCCRVWEERPDEFERWFTNAVCTYAIRTVVLESFSLYGDKAMEQTGSSFLTCQLIGSIKYIIKRHNFLFGGEHYVERVDQQPAIKKPAFAILKKAKYEFTADLLKVPGQHVRDAEVHGVKYIRDTLGEKMHRKAPEFYPEQPLEFEAEQFLAPVWGNPVVGSSVTEEEETDVPTSE